MLIRHLPEEEREYPEEQIPQESWEREFWRQWGMSMERERRVHLLSFSI
jgi:hypothetical protein